MNETINKILADILLYKQQCKDMLSTTISLDEDSLSNMLNIQILNYNERTHFTCRCNIDDVDAENREKLKAFTQEIVGDKK